MESFKPGMKVKCVEASGNVLEKGRVYTVRALREDCPSDIFIGESSWSWHKRHFEPVDKADKQAPVGVALALPTESAARKAIPLVRGCLDYFPAALAAVAELSRKGNEKHNPGEPMHHARGKSTDHADCIVRHLLDRGTVDPDDNIRHSVKVAWRALALLQEELEAAGAPPARGAKL